MARAAAYRRRRSIEVGDGSPAAPKQGQVQLKSAFTGICGTDLHIFHSDMHARVNPPLGPGHETSGRVGALGDTQALRDEAERDRSILERIPAARWGTGDLAGPTVFLAAKASDYLNGVVLPVGGGWLGR